MKKTYAVTCENVTFRYFEQEPVPTLNQVNLQLEAGKITILMGRSGCGKSTLAAVLAGLYPENGGILEAGTICLNGKQPDNPAKRCEELSQMFQNPDLQFCMNTLRKEMQFCLENICVPAEEMDERIAEAAKLMGVEKLLDRELFSLSGGEKQKAMLSCQFLLRSNILLLDEPFANIDTQAAKELIKQIYRLNQTYKTTILVIDHSLHLWMDVLDEVKILGTGGALLQEHITRDNLLEYTDLFEQEGLRFAKAVLPKKRDSKRGENVIELKSAAIFPGKKKRRIIRETSSLLKEVTAAFSEQSMTAILGASGSGKSTLFRTLLGQQKYEGSIQMNGVELSKMREKDIFQTIGIVFQNPSNQFVTQRVEDEIITSIQMGNYGVENPQEMALALLEEFGLRTYRNYSPYMLSQGQQRRLAVLAVLAGNQRILLLDEPTYGQDERSTKAIMELLKKRVEQDKLTVIFSTHDNRLVEEWADFVYEVRENTLKEWSVD